MNTIYFEYMGRLMSGNIMGESQGGYVITSGNEVLWLPTTEPHFNSMEELQEYKCAHCPKNKTLK